MNRFHLKIIAALTMVIDHVGFIFLNPDTDLYTISRAIGRIAFVLFAYMIAEGFHNTKDLKAYILRLAVFAGLLELFLIGYYFLIGVNMILNFNILWTLLFGLLSIYLFSHKNHYYKIPAILLVLLAELLDLSYGGYGVLMILFFGIYRNKITNLSNLILLNLLFIDKPLYTYLGWANAAKFPVIQWFSVLAIIFIFLYNGQMGKYKLKWFFYLFYPAHLALLYLINILFF
jgi:hypothetical protein